MSHDHNTSIYQSTHRDDVLEGIVSLVSLLELCHANLNRILSQEYIRTHHFKIIHEKLG